MAAGQRINLAEKFAGFSDRWSPKIIDTIDDYEIKVVKVNGDFVWHKHEAEDELFIVMKGRLRMDFRDRSVELGPGDMIVVPKATEHKPFAADECEILLMERKGVVNTGDAPVGALTQQQAQRI